MMLVLGLAVWLIIGIAAGVAYFISIWWSARLFAAGGRATVTISLALLRLLALGGLLSLAAFQGGGPLLATALGVVVTRFWVMRRLREATP